MKPLMQGIASKTLFAAVALLGSLFSVGTNAQAAENGPMIKNLMALTYRAPAASIAVHEGLTRKEVKRLMASAEPSDHMKLARYYRDKAEGLDAQAAGYEQAAVAFRQGPIVKNLTAPNTAARYESIAKGLREQATENRDRAESQERATNIAVAIHS